MLTETLATRAREEKKKMCRFSEYMRRSSLKKWIDISCRLRPMSQNPLFHLLQGRHFRGGLRDHGGMNDAFPLAYVLVCASLSPCVGWREQHARGIVAATSPLFDLPPCVPRPLTFDEILINKGVSLESNCGAASVGK